MHMVVRVDDVMHFKCEDLMPQHLEFDFALKSKMCWSKNVLDERATTDQIILGAADPTFCTILALSVHLEEAIKNGLVGDMTSALFGITKQLASSKFKQIVDSEDFDKAAVGELGSHSTQKYAATLARQNRCTQDDVDARGRWKGQRLMNVTVFTAGSSTTTMTTTLTRSYITSVVIFIVIGGLIQFFTCLQSFCAHDHSGGSAFGVFSSFWFLLGLLELLNNTISNSNSNSNGWEIPVAFILAILSVNVALLTISPFLPLFNMCILTAISVPVGLEAIIRYIEDSNVQLLSSLKIVQGVSQFILAIVASYGVAAAILHGIHERQVLPRFEDAIIESVLWKRKVNIHKYTEGKWANPKPLSSFSFALGYIGLFLGMGKHFIYENSGGAYTSWFSIFAVLQWVTVFLFALRKEIIHMNNALINSLILADFSYSSSVALLRVAFFVCTVLLLKKITTTDVSNIDIISYGMNVLSLFVTSVALIFFKRGSLLAALSQILIMLAILTEIYCATAELLNSITQKQILPVNFNLLEVKKENIATTHSDIESLGSESEMAEKDAIIRFVPPLDEKLFGQSDLESPIVPFFVGLACYSSMKVLSIITSLLEIETGIETSQVFSF